MKSSHEFCAGVREKEYVIRLIKQGFIKHSRGSEACAVPLRFAETAVVGYLDVLMQRCELKLSGGRCEGTYHLKPQVEMVASRRLKCWDWRHVTQCQRIWLTPPSHTHHAPLSPTSQLSHLETQRDVLRDSQCTSSQFITVGTGSLLSPYQLQNLTLCLSLCYRPDIAYTQSSWSVDYLIWNSS